MYLAVEYLPVPLDYALLVATKDAFFSTVLLEPNTALDVLHKYSEAQSEKAERMESSRKLP